MLSLHRSATGQIAMMALLTAFVFRALIPLGFMPDFTSGGGMVICSGYEQVTVPQDADASTGADHGAKQPCGFALNHTFMDAPSASLLDAPVYAGAAQPPMDAYVHHTIFSTYRTRAPPLA